jgi:surface protein
MNMFIRFPSQALFKTIVPQVLLVFLLPCTLLYANNPPTGAVTISGTAQVGQTLTVANTLADPDGLGAITYQWKRDGVPIMYGGTLKDGVGGVDGLFGAYNVTLSADGKHAYVTGVNDAAVSWYERNASTGALTYGGMLKDGVDGLDSALDVTLSADGKHAYVTGVNDAAVSWFTRDPVTGTLSYGPASDANYTLTTADVGAVITVTASYTDGGTTAESVASAGTALVSTPPLTDSNFTTAVNMWFDNEANANATYGHIRDWNVSGVTNMFEAFKDKASFDENISGWDTSSVTNMSGMFWGASEFNQPIGNWNVSSVTNMQATFMSASSFN